MENPNVSRRAFLKSASLAAGGLCLTGCLESAKRHSLSTSAISSYPPEGIGATLSPGALTVNDIHSQLNSAVVAEILRPQSVDECQHMIKQAIQTGKPVSIAGGRHSMGGQQFADGSLLVDTRAMNRVLNFDREKGLLTVEAGIEWPELIEYLHQQQDGQPRQWAIVQKQTGADKFTLGGSLASNVHGRALDRKPIVADVESFSILDSHGELQHCDRSRNSELFRVAIGGYGLFGMITSVTLRLRERVKVRRVVEIRDLKDIPDAFERRIADGYLYGDFQFATDSHRPSFLRRGVFSCYQPVPMSTPITEHPTRFSPEDWAKLTYYTHKYKRKAFEIYTTRYLQTSGQIYWSDSQLFGSYLDDYHKELDRKLNARVPGTEMITEIDVPRSALVDFMEEAGDVLRKQNANVIYGVVRLIEKDDESFMPWAKDRYACVVFNLHVTHDRAHVEAAARSFRSLIDLAIKHNGTYYLTYHRFAERAQVEHCYPEFGKFLELKRQYDPSETFQSNWYRHYREMFRA
jgi:FAD/FMN-containing dehydrogenase